MAASVSEARWYSPEIGRFLTVDPLGYAGGDINLYRFVGNNPVNFIDPLGLDPRGWHSPYPSHRWNSTYSPALDNSVLKCHVATHNDPLENVIGGIIVGGPLVTYGGALAVPYISSAAQSAAIAVLSNPAALATIQKKGYDLIMGVVPGSWTPTSLEGYATAIPARAIQLYYENLKR
jgi:uncharacterized protein RhaS with RHS repeats